MFDYWYAFPVVLLGCALTVMGGVGGNVLCGPFFMLVLHLPPKVAISTALVTEVFSMSSGVAGYAWRRLIDYRLALVLAAAAVPMAILGSVLSVRAPGAVLRAVFGAVILLVAGLLLRSPEAAETVEAGRPADGPETAASGHSLQDSRRRSDGYELRGQPQLAATSLAAGLGSGLVGIGGGELNTPAMVLHGVPIRVAAATAVAVMALTVLAGASTHVLIGQPLWRLALWTIPAAMLGGQIGSYAASRVSPTALRKWLSWLFVVVGSVMLAAAAAS